MSSSPPNPKRKHLSTYNREEAEAVAQEYRDRTGLSGWIEADRDYARVEFTGYALVYIPTQEELDQDERELLEATVSIAASRVASHKIDLKHAQESHQAAKRALEKYLTSVPTSVS